MTNPHDRVSFGRKTDDDDYERKPSVSEAYGTHRPEQHDPVEPWRFQKHANPRPSWIFVVALVAGFVLALALGWWLG